MRFSREIIRALLIPSISASNQMIKEATGQAIFKELYIRRTAI
jgi:hypothetical protein